MRSSQSQKVRPHGFPPTITYRLPATHLPALFPNPLEQAFGAKNLADLGQEAEDFAVFHWSVTNWTHLDKRLTSPVFECGGHKW